MTDDVLTRQVGKVGRVTFNRPKALNALSPEMCAKIEAAVDAWAGDPGIAMLVIDAEGEKAFCAGGDIAAMYHRGIAGDFEGARKFWRDEYRLNAKLFNYPKPVAAFMQGFTMGGGVGIGGHGSHRVVGDSSRVAMPECGIGLVPDVGGSLILARAPGRLGEYIGLTGARLKAADAILTGFADYYIPEGEWPDLIARLEDTGDWTSIDAAAVDPGPASLAGQRSWIDATFAGAGLVSILNVLAHDSGGFAAQTAKLMAPGSPLSQATTLELIRRSRGRDTIEGALELEYRGTYRAISQGDFLEGVRALLIDKDKAPKWNWDAASLPGKAVVDMLLPMGDAALKLEETS